LPSRTGADDGDRFDRRFQWQEVALVFQQHHGFARSFESELAMSGRVVVGETKLRPGHRFRGVKHAQAESRFKQMLYRAVDIA